MSYESVGAERSTPGSVGTVHSLSLLIATPIPPPARTLKIHYPMQVHKQQEQEQRK